VNNRNDISTPPFFWLASFPRSGNTFVRNIFFEVFGLESGTCDIGDDGEALEPGCFRFPVVKTHMLPSRLPEETKGTKAIYLLRDGRDAMVSIAHHRSDIIAPGSDFMENLRAAIYAEKGSFFGGWSKNAEEWLQRADLVVRYEDLITDPVACMERMRTLLELPPGDYTKIPGFESMKFGIPRYGAGRDQSMTEEEQRNLARLNFRKGKAGAWKEEMPTELHDLFWSIHGDTMLKMGYRYEGGMPDPPDQDMDWDLSQKLYPGGPEVKERNRIRVVIEADKLISPVNDGVKRYEMLLLKELLHVHRNPSGRWLFDLSTQSGVAPIEEFASLITEKFSAGKEGHHAVPLATPLAARVQQAILRAVPERFKAMLVQRNIMILHRIYDGAWGVVHAMVSGARMTLRFFRRQLQWVQMAFGAEGSSEQGRALARYDLIHLPLQHHYQNFVKATAPVVVTLHDFTHALFPHFHTPVNIRNAEKGWRFAARKAKGMIAVSASTARDTLTVLSDPQKIPVYTIHEAVERESFHYRVNSDDRHAVCTRYGIPEGVPFFLTLSSIEPRKNLEGVIQAFFHFLAKDSGANVMLVVAGKKAWGGFHPQKLSGFDPSRVIFTGFVDDQDLPALYSEALGFCYLSHYEGFGLPLLEALNCGTPVIYGDNSSLPEVAGDAGLPVDASDTKAIAHRMAALFYDETLRHSLGRAALKQAARFSRRRMARETLNVYFNTIQNV
jgi:glycosyltransferase involved in cell wall biosynthesis